MVVSCMNAMTKRMEKSKTKIKKPGLDHCIQKNKNGVLKLPITSIYFVLKKKKKKKGYR